MTYPTTKLGDVAEFIRGITFKPDDVVPLDADDAVVCMRTKNVQVLLDCDDLLAVPSQFVRRRDQYLEEGDILVSSANSWNLVGKCCWIPSLPWRAAFGGFISVLRGDSARVDRRYLYWWFASDRIQALLRSFGQKTTNISNLNIERCLQLDLPLPSLPEQRRIAAILDKADALRTKRREALAQLDRLAQSIFVGMFGDPATNPKGWPERSMSELFETSPIFGTMIPPSADGGEWLSLRVANIQDWRLDLSDQKFVTLPANMVERHSVKDGDLLLARAIASQEHLGKAVVATPSGRKWAFDSHLMRLRFNHAQALPEFVRHLWMTTGGRSLFLKATRRSAVQFNINTKEMNSLALPMPPVQLQREFVNRIQALDSIRHKQKLVLIEFDGLFATLQHRAFRGEL